MKDFVASIWNKILEEVSASINFIIENLNKLISGFNTVFRTSIPPIEEMVATLQEVGSAVRDNIDDFIRLGVTVPHVMTVAEAEAERFKGKMDEVGDSMEVLDAAQRKLAEGLLSEDGIGGALDEIVEVKMATMEERFRAFNQSMAIHRDPGGGGMSAKERELADDPLGIKAAYFAAGFTVGKGNRPDPEPQGIPAGMMGQGYFSMGLEAQMRGEDPARVVQVAINGKNIDEAGGDEEAYSAEFPTGGEA